MGPANPAKARHSRSSLLWPGEPIRLFAEVKAMQPDRRIRRCAGALLFTQRRDDPENLPSGSLSQILRQETWARFQSPLHGVKASSSGRA